MRRRRKIAMIAVIVVVLLVAVTCVLPYYFWWRSLPRRAYYTDDYVSARKGTVQIEIPEVYELANIAIALTDYGREKPHAVRKQGEYYERVMEHFLPYRDHPLISVIEPAKQKPFSRYYGFRDNSARYYFEGDRIMAMQVYPYRWTWSYDIFTQHIHLAEDFARKSGFRAFFTENESYYQDRINAYRRQVPVRGMWEWLEQEFPQQYDSYKIVFSPLIGGSHSTHACQGDGFTEAIMFVSGPREPSPDAGSAGEGLLSRVLFTEIDHHYVNPTTWEHWFQVCGAFHQGKEWNQQGGYRDPMSTFNEYMTWAVFLLHADDTYDGAAFEEIKRVTIRLMEERRKFVRFGAFADKLLELYRNRDEGVTIPDLYPAIVGWADGMQEEV